MSRVVKNNRGFLQLLADCPHQRQFLLKTATPQQMHALVQIIHNVLHENIPIPEENKRKVLRHKDALVNLDVPYKTKTWLAEGQRDLTDNRSVWEWIKYNIRAHAIQHSKKRAKEKKEIEMN